MILTPHVVVSKVVCKIVGKFVRFVECFPVIESLNSVVITSRLTTYSFCPFIFHEDQIVKNFYCSQYSLSSPNG